MVLRVSGGTCELIYLVITIRAKCAIAKPATIMTTVSSMVRGAIGVPNTSMVPGIPNHDPVMIGVFPIPPLFTPTAVAKNVFLKFNTSVIVDQRSQAVVYGKMPVEIGIYRQSKDEEVLLDSFSRKRQQYALYGSPESGVVCRYTETEISVNNDDMKPAKYEDALVRIRIKNDIDNIVKVSRVIIPMDGVVLDHAHDDAWLPGSVEMDLSTSFGKDMVHVRLMSTKVKRSDKTSIRARKEETLVFLMDAGY